MKRLLLGVAAVLGAGAAWALEPVRIAHAAEQSGPYAEYARQLRLGLELGFHYATDGSGRLLGRPLLIEPRDAGQSAADARAALAAAYAEGAVLALGPVANDRALAVLPVAAEWRRILIPQATADAITGTAWNRYVFRVNRSWSQEAIANAAVTAQPGTCIAAIAPERGIGRSGVDIYRRAANKLGAIVYHEEYVPEARGDLTGAVARLVDALEDRGGCRRKYLFAAWPGTAHPFDALPATAPAGIGLTAGGSPAAPAVYRGFPGLEGAAYYHYRGPTSAANDWLVVEHFERFNRPPTPYVVQGMAEAMFIVAAVERAQSLETERLIEAMEGLRFDSPKGWLTMRPEDHQALQPMYQFRIDGGGEPELIREITAEEIELPVRNRP